MRTFVILLLILLVLAGIGVAAYQPLVEAYRQRTAPKWRTADVVEGDIVSVVNSTGTIKPVLQVTVGSFVSGPILELYCEFNQEVDKDELMAEIDPRIYEANVARDKATLALARGRSRAGQSRSAAGDQRREAGARPAGRRSDVHRPAEIDKVRFNRLALEAQLTVSKTSVDQAQAQLDQSVAQLNYTKILAPCDGIVINRKIDPGQTVAAQFQTPELFIVAPDMHKKMHVHASVDEADMA